MDMGRRDVYKAQKVVFAQSYPRGLELIAERLPVLAKATANYANSVLARIEAINHGYDASYDAKFQWQSG